MPDKPDSEKIRLLLLSFPAKAIPLLYKHYYHVLLNISKAFTKDDAAAEDIVFETFIYTWENHKTIGKPNDQSIQHFLIRVIKYKSITFFKERQKAAEAHQEFTADQDSVIPSAESTIILSENRDELWKIIATFPPREQECLVMKFQDGLSPDEIASVMSVTRKAVERSLTSAKKRLKKHLLGRNLYDENIVASEHRRNNDFSEY
jgi:RNA polymerase sigma factor (sigma-70 family)